MTVEFEPADVASPKRSHFGDRSRIADWYGYYAGFSVEFVRDIISVMNPDKDGLILDPWNGAGTTTLTASRLGYRSFGNDLNPVMRIISQARCARSSDFNDLIPNASRKLKGLKPKDQAKLPWLHPDTATEVDRIRSLVSSRLPLDSDKISTAESILLTALFLTLKAKIEPILGTNPAWWKSECTAPIHTDPLAFRMAFFETLTDLDTIEPETLLDSECLGCNPTLHTGHACELPLESASVSMIVTSPPYLTRLDYVRATLVELSILGYAELELESLRRKMTGSVMGGAEVDYLLEWGSEAKDALEHAKMAAIVRSRGDGNYYAGTFSRYFSDLYESMKEMNRVLSPGGTVTIVVQGSRHRGKVIDLPQVVHQMGESLGWVPLRAVAWPTRDLGRINSRSRVYGLQTVHETAVLFRKP